MSTNKSRSGKKGGDYIPDIKKIEKKIQAENKKNLVEVPSDVGGDKLPTVSSEEIPERKEDNESPLPEKE